MGDDPLSRCAQENEFLQAQIMVLEQRIGNVSMLLADWDGYYNPQTKRGNAEELAKLIEEAYILLQGRSWRGQESY
jgi:hypothetical protein